MVAFQHTVDCLQTIGVRRQRTVRLLTIDRMFVYNHLDVFFNQPDDFKKHRGVFKKHQAHLKSPKGALSITQGSVD